ncbi:MAG: alpha/beta hydrolase [Coraliomargarita sp.]
MRRNPLAITKMLLQTLSLPLTAIAIAYFGLILYALLRADSLIFPNVPASYTLGAGIQMLKSSDGEQIAASYLPVASTETLLLYCHGNGEDIGDARSLMEQYQQRGIATLVFDYPGYGISSGKATESGCHAATLATYRYAVDELGYRPEQISLYGRSLGGGPACWLAAREPVGSLILDGTFTSTFRVMTHRKLLPWDVFDNLAHLPEIECPVLILHGTEDRTVPFSHAPRNYAAVRGDKEKLWVAGAAHNNLIEVAGETYWSTVLSFLEKQHRKMAK